MSRYRMDYWSARSWDNLGLVEPGQIIEADQNPDPQFFVDDDEVDAVPPADTSAEIETPPAGHSTGPETDVQVAPETVQGPPAVPATSTTDAPDSAPDPS
jgi:hypothetical protein